MLKESVFRYHPWKDWNEWLAVSILVQDSSRHREALTAITSWVGVHHRNSGLLQSSPHFKFLKM